MNGFLFVSLGGKSQRYEHGHVVTQIFCVQNTRWWWKKFYKFSQQAIYMLKRFSHHVPSLSLTVFQLKCQLLRLIFQTCSSHFPIYTKYHATKSVHYSKKSYGPMSPTSPACVTDVFLLLLLFCAVV